MKHLYFLLPAVFSTLTALSQDTCAYVSQQNQIGGLDCAMGSTAPFIADSYQWLNCDNLFSADPADTNGYYSGVTSINVALVLNYLGCIDTSECAYVCTWGIEEFNHPDRKLLQIIDLNGNETDEQTNSVIIYVYSDGSRQKRFRVE